MLHTISASARPAPICIQHRADVTLQHRQPSIHCTAQLGFRSACIKCRPTRPAGRKRSTLAADWRRAEPPLILGHALPGARMQGCTQCRGDCADWRVPGGGRCPGAGRRRLGSGGGCRLGDMPAKSAQRMQRPRWKTQTPRNVAKLDGRAPVQHRLLGSGHQLGRRRARGAYFLAA